jgi:coproporphyrinogen III oxidase
MILTPSLQLKDVENRFLKARLKVIEAFETFECLAKFEKKTWDYKHTGGGEMAVCRGHVFEKAAVNFSHIAGPCFPMHDGEGAFSAIGISLITHMQNPFVPTAHFNVRLLVTEQKSWIGGGFDLTPMAQIEPEDIVFFHQQAKSCLDQYDESFYPEFKKNADDYFYIPHRQKTRGIGGVFFDHLHLGDEDKNITFLEKLTEGFLNAYIPMITKYKDKPFSEADKQLQNKLRAHYVEFNLIYDRGTRFGFVSGGNPDAILCSMPPCATW